MNIREKELMKEKGEATQDRLLRKEGKESKRKTEDGGKQETRE